jgi:hypothetical protein
MALTSMLVKFGLKPMRSPLGQYRLDNPVVEDLELGNYALVKFIPTIKGIHPIAILKPVSDGKDIRVWANPLALAQESNKDKKLLIGDYKKEWVLNSKVKFGFKQGEVVFA